MTTDEKLEQAWIAVTLFEDGSVQQLSICHHLVCHSGDDAPDDEPCTFEGEQRVCTADREMLKMLDLARYVRDDEGDTDEQSFRARWHAGRPS
jgi:hypothetical protein